MKRIVKIIGIFLISFSLINAVEATYDAIDIWEIGCSGWDVSELVVSKYVNFGYDVENKDGLFGEYVYVSIKAYGTAAQSKNITVFYKPLNSNIKYIMQWEELREMNIISYYDQDLRIPYEVIHYLKIKRSDIVQYGTKFGEYISGDFYMEVYKGNGSDISNDYTRVRIKGESLNLKATVNINMNGNPQISWNPVSWNDGYNIMYNVYRSTTQTFNYSKPLKTTTDTFYNDTSLVNPKIKYYYQIVAYKQKSGLTEAEKIYGDAVLLEPVISNLKAPQIKITEFGSGIKTAAKLSWNKVDAAEKYNIFANKNGAGYKLIAETSEMEYIDYEYMSGTEVYYKIKAVNSALESEYSNEVRLNSIEF